MNDFNSLIKDYCARLKKVIDSLDIASVDNVIQVLEIGRREGRNIFIMGNGGSAATASHIACDLNKVASEKIDKRFKVISLNDSIPVMLAISNDINYESVFVEQLKNLFAPGDIVVGISGSGNSRNIINGIDYANANGGVTIGLCGYSGGLLNKKVNHSIHINIDDMQLSEDMHLILGHIFMKAFNPGC